MSKVVIGTILLLIASTVWAASVPDTGQTICYDDSGNVIPCPYPGQNFYGQDGNYSIHMPSYTKLDANGKDLPVSAISWEMVRDNVTGLIWEVKTHKDGIVNYNDPHDADNSYPWYDSHPASNGGYAGDPNNIINTETFIKQLNNSQFGGYSDWRLPSIKESVYLIDKHFDYPELEINTDYFPNTAGEPYWTSTTCVFYNPSSWYVSFTSGTYTITSKSDNHMVRAVRGGYPQQLYVDNGNGTVTDPSTGLMWQTAAPNNVMTWKNALSYCESLTLGSYTDWRMPTIKELVSLVDFSRVDPSINYSFFPGTALAFYWSSTTFSSDYPGYAYGVEFESGSDWNNGISGNDKTAYAFIRAVRSGWPQIIPADPTPAVMANGQRASITVSETTPVSIALSMTPGNQTGKNADWWILADTPWGWYILSSYGWTSDIVPIIQYPLFILSPIEIFSSKLSAGDYAFYFAVDTTADGVLDDPLYYDGVQVHVTQ